MYKKGDLVTISLLRVPIDQYVKAVQEIRGQVFPVEEDNGDYVKLKGLHWHFDYGDIEPFNSIDEFTFDEVKGLL